MPDIWGTVKIGRLTLREGYTLADTTNANTGERGITLSGEESSPPLTVAELQQRREDFAGLLGTLVPVTFTIKTEYNGWYAPYDINIDATNWTNEVVKFSWSIRLSRIGAENSTDIESRLTGAGRLNTYSLTGERWHAPAASAYGYFTGTSQPSGSVSRVLADGGSITVYRGIPTSINPRWGTSLTNYYGGRSRVLVGGAERQARDVVISASATWEMNNGLVKVQPGASATLQVSAWDGAAWDRIDWNASVTASASGPITSWDGVSIIRNDFELVTVRLVKDRAPGRTMLDLSLRRGARAVETYLQTDTSTTKSWYRAVTEAGTAPASASYVAATVNDANGNQYVVGAATSFTAQTGVGGITKAAALALDAFIGAVVGGSAAPAGETASVIRDHYIVSMAETTMAVRR